MPNLRSVEARLRQQERYREHHLKKEQRKLARTIINRYQHIDLHKVPGEKIYTILTKQKVYSALIEKFGYAHPAVTGMHDCGEVLNSKPMLQYGYGFVE